MTLRCKIPIDLVSQTADAAVALKGSREAGLQFDRLGGGTFVVIYKNVCVLSLRHSV